ncbi:MAG: hypothetical protein IKA43_04205 [Clostridia bacterium]|nr:hypothetical protein [Clostridia bacterium]MBR2296591.1 hypothetical protein [Clostridia bacterium]
MRRIVALLLALVCVFTFASCDNSTELENKTEIPLESSSEPDGYEFVLNTSTKKYHTQFCTYAINMDESSKETTTDIEFIIERGYTPCGSCIARA